MSITLPGGSHHAGPDRADCQRQRAKATKLVDDLLAMMRLTATPTSLAALYTYAQSVSRWERDQRAAADHADARAPRRLRLARHARLRHLHRRGTRPAPPRETDPFVLDRRRFLQLVGMGLGAGLMAGPTSSLLDQLAARARPVGLGRRTDRRPRRRAAS